MGMSLKKRLMLMDTGPRPTWNVVKSNASVKKLEPYTTSVSNWKASRCATPAKCLRRRATG